jgi:hypothetical protein
MDDIQGTLMLSWHDIIKATQNRRKWRDLIYKAIENRK